MGGGGAMVMRRVAAVDGGDFSRRPIPKRGQVKVGIVVGIAHSFAAMFSLGVRRRFSGSAAAVQNAALMASTERN